MSKSRRSRTRGAKARAAERARITEQLAASLAAVQYTTLYFAYGSNMPSRDMQARCPGARNPRVARLANYRLHFSGCADVREAEGAEVWGIVWEVTDAHMASLDRYEGCNRDPWKPGGFYQRKLVTVDIAGAGPTEVVVYVMCVDAATGRAYLPGGYYVNTLERGYAEFGIEQGAESLRWALNEITALHAGRELTLDRKGRARPAGDALYVPEAFRTAPAWPRSRAGQRAVARERNLEAQRRSQARLAAGYDLPVGFVEVDGDARASARAFLEGEGMLDWEIEMLLDDVDAQADALGYVAETADYLEGSTSGHPTQTLAEAMAEADAWAARNRRAEAV